MTSRTPLTRKLCMAGALIGAAVTLGACQHTSDQMTTASVPDDYRLRHPIAVEEANHSVVVLVGHGRGGLSAEQRGDVMALPGTWRHEATGPITPHTTLGTSNMPPAPAACRAQHTRRAP